MENSNGNEGIAVIGMACRFPQANSVEEYWDILKKGLNTSSSPPPDRLLLTPINPQAKANFLKCPVDQFDAPFFGISPNEAVFTDPQTRLLLEVSWEAIEDAGINPEKLVGSQTGVFYGSWLQDYKELLNKETESEQDFLRKYLCNGFGCTSAKLSLFYGLKGPNIATESGCSSSMMAVHMACQSLKSGDCSIAIASGANIILQWSEQDLTVWAKDGKSKAFDKDANGYGRGEAVGVLILKRFSQALKDGDRIHGVILGSAASQEGLSNSFGTPTVASELRAMKAAIKNAGIDPNQVDYVEAHGTGTLVGDPTEASAIIEAYASKGGRRENPLLIGSGKTNIGHTESSSGLAGIIKVILAMKNELIPPHINLKEINAKINFDNIPGKIAVKLTDWKRDPNRPRIAGISSFGITGTDAHLIIQEAPILSNELNSEKLSEHEVLTNIIAISGKNLEALDEGTAFFQKFLKESKENLGDIAYSANACRTHHPFRRILVGNEKSDIVKKIQDENWKSGSIRKEKGKICFIFSGLVGDINFEPAKKLYETCPTFRIQMDHCNKIACDVVNVSIMEIMEEKLRQSLTVKEFYFFTLAVQYSLSKLWEVWGIKPHAVMGHSIGEISAAVVSGVMDFGAALKMLNKMKIPKEVANPSTFMMAINASEEMTTELLSQFNDMPGNETKWVEISARNSKFQTVVTGKMGGLQGFKSLCVENGLKCKDLSYGAFGLPLHSKAMEEYLPSGWSIEGPHQPPDTVYISSVKGTQVEKLFTNYWRELFIRPVNYFPACIASKDVGSNVYIEIGLGKTLAKLTEENIEDENIIFLSSLYGKGDRIWEGLLNTLGSLHINGIEIDWEKFYEYTPKRKVSLPHYPFQRKSYWFKKNPDGQRRHGVPFRNDSKQKDHPLLGSCLSLAAGVSRETTIFQNEILSIDPNFLKDHCIGESVIFPAAAFLEMILSAGKLNKMDKEQNLRSHDYISVEDFIVHSPLHLKEEGNLRLQTVIDNGISSQISIYSLKSNKKSSWTLHASATLKMEKDERPILVDPSNKLDLALNLDEEEVRKFYERHSKLGLNFGAAFRSLKKVNFKNAEEFIALVNLPEKEESVREFILHPILIDSMVQSVLFHSNPNFGKLRVPVQVKNLCVFPDALLKSKAQKDKSLFLHCKTDKMTSQISQVSLTTGNGELLCIMKHPEFVATSVNAILHAAGVEEEEGSEKEMPNLYTISWKKSDPPPNQSFIMDKDKDGPKLQNLWLLFNNSENNPPGNLISKIEAVGKNVKAVSLVSLEKQKIEQVLGQNKDNLEGIFYIAMSNQKQNSDQRSLVEPLLNILQFLLKSKLRTLPKLYVVTANVWKIGNESKIYELNPSSASLWGLIRSARLEIPGLQTKLIDLENFQEELISSECLGDQLINEVLLDDKESEVAYRNGNRYVRRMEDVSNKNKNSRLQFPLSARFTVETPKSKMISDLRYIPNDSQEVLKLAPTQIEVAVRSTSLNFRDVLIIMKPAPVFDEMNSIGSDYAGVVTAIGTNVREFNVGDEVCGLSLKDSTIASHITAEEGLATKIPKTLNFSEGATLPVVFLTAWHCIVNLAKLKRDQTILIHAASGGVGLMAIQIAKMLGLRVIGTAGNNFKQQFVKSLGIHHVFDSRSLEFGEEIKKLTNGKGVDMILNCLTGPGFKETSLEICKNEGYFIEISKLDIWTLKEVEERRPDVHYHIVNLPDVDLLTMKEMFGKLNELLKKGTIKPLCYTRFLASNVVDAFNYLQKAKHIGKIVVDLPVIEREGNLYEEKLFNERSSYLITGGRGAIGLAIAKWMANQGANHIILVGRSEPSLEALEAIRTIEKDGVKIYSEQEDISDFEKCREFIERLEKHKNIPPLRGIHHCAGVLSDRMILQQDWVNFEHVFKPKVKGGYNLHVLTLDYPLEFFVVHSSISSTLGNIGQSNYAAANAYLDSLIEMRGAMGLQGKVVNWGQWEAGMGEGLELQFAHSFPIHQGINVLQKVFVENQTSMVAGNVNFSWLTKTFPNFGTTLLENISWSKEISGGYETRVIKEVPAQQRKFFIETFNSIQDKADKMEAIETFVAKIAKDTLGLKEGEVLERNLLFAEMGMDSIMSIEFVNRLQADVGQEFQLGFVDMEESGTVVQISQILFERLSSE